MAAEQLRRSVLMVTATYDHAPEYVEPHLKERGLVPFRFDTDSFPATSSLVFDPGGELIISNGSETILASSVRSIWYRRMVAPDLPADLDDGERDFCERETHALLLGALLSLRDREWVSHPEAIWTAESKPYQLAVARQLGFRIPETRMTNAPSAVRAFASSTHQLVAKALSSGYVVREDGNAAIFTSLVRETDLDDLDALTLAPATFQEHIEKVYDIRVTVVGHRVFAAEIRSQERQSSRIDWRATDDPDIVHRRLELPPDIRTRCIDLVRELNLSFGAIDLVLGRDGEIYFLEINPNGEWHWIEDRLQYPIGASIAAELDA